MTGEDGLKRVARSLGLIPPTSEEQESRLFLTRLAMDPRHPFNLDMVDVVMGMPEEKRHDWLVKAANAYPTPIEIPLEAIGLAEDASSSGQPTSTSERRTEPPKSKASTESGEGSIVPGSAQAVAQDSPTGLPSSEESSGALTRAGSSFGTEVYRRLPLAAKRDAFIHDGFLYVRQSTLKEWVANLTHGKCCLPQRDGMAYHATECWVERG